ncbi:unnamed protein product [Bursaphelenchus okinawaensis]|uniref:7TM_GPCR_Srx domain-containing protein n=1 Tax=Bursaphelenchus okinawaensis TaxID=465554 RepID=A0A811KGT8_9BILA|nr:unnamed protein product [Bursaphelenchus okinawaensis]CAG9102691.1 unnamed protein product [Bursaphelenchus okinawaensis]
MSLLCFSNHLLSQIVERFVATMLLSRYEKIGERFPWIAVLIIVAQWLYAALTLKVMLARNILFIRVFSSIIEIVITIIVYFMLPSISRKKYEQYKPQCSKTSTNTRIRSSLSLRYQTSENLKIANLTSRIILIQIISNSLTLTIHGCGRLFEPDTFEWNLIMKTLHWVIYIAAFIQQCQVMQEIRMKKHKVLPNAVVIRSAEEERQIYFEQYNHIWNS